MTAAEADQMGVTSRGRRSWLERVPCWVQRLVTTGVLADDPEEERLRKASLTLTATLVSALAIVWVTTRRLGMPTWWWRACPNLAPKAVAGPPAQRIGVGEHTSGL